MMRDIQVAVTNQDAGALERSAHALKGSIGNFSTGRAYAITQRLEMMGQARDLGSAATDCTALETAIARFAQARTRFRSGSHSS